MALVVSKAARLKPHIQLQQAIVEFEESLNSKQKQTLNRYKQVTRQKPLTEQDVFALTQELDRRYVRRGPSPSSCIGPRFHKFLQGIQHFASIGDVIIGGSQNLIASGVWTGIRLALLAIVDCSLYVEKLSKIFMSIGKTNSHLRDLTDHFEHSPRLRSLICEYHTIVVKFCTVLVKHTEKNPLGRFIHSLSESVLTDFQTAMKEQQTVVQQEVTILTAREIRENGQNSSSLKSLVSGQAQRAQKQQTAAVKRAILDHCSTYDYEQAWRTIRKAGTATVQRGDYLKWREAKEQTTLLVIGKLGYGKSVLLANIIDDLHLNTVPGDCIIAYFFCKHDETRSLCPKTILGCIARQLLQQVSDLDRLEPVLSYNPSIATFEQVIRVLPNLIPSTSRVLIVIDGLNECKSEDRQEVLNVLRPLQDQLKTLICSSVRSTSEAPPQAGYELHPNLMKLHMSDDNPDLEAFIERELIARLEAREIVLRDPLLILEIQENLLTQSEGMFLWVKLQIYYLCDMKTDDAMRAAFSALPRTLSETFTNILRRSVGDLWHEQQTLLQIILAAFQSLTTDQLLEVMSVCPGDSVWNPSKVLNSMNPILSTCGPLMVVDEENDTVHLLHQSFRQFLEEGADGIFQPECNRNIGYSVMVDRVITYLTYNIFDRDVSRAVAPSVAGAQASANVIRSLPPTWATKTAVRLLKSKTQTIKNVDIGHLLWQHRDQDDAIQEPHPFYDYCKLYWREHVLQATGFDASIYPTLRNFLTTKANEFISTDEDRLILLLEAMLGSNSDVAEALVDIWKIGIDDIRVQRPGRLTELVETCLKSDCIVLADGLLSSDILWVFGTRAACCGLTGFAMSCLAQACQRRNRSYNRLLEVLTPLLGYMLRAKQTKVYYELLLSALCRRDLTMDELAAVFGECGVKKPLDHADLLHAAGLDIDLAREAFENRSFDVFLIMYGYPLDRRFIAPLIMWVSLLDKPCQQAVTPTRVSPEITFEYDKAPQGGTLMANVVKMLRSELLCKPQQVEGLVDLLDQLLQSHNSKHSETQLSSSEADSVRVILLLFATHQELTIAASCVQNFPDDFFSLQKIVGSYVPKIRSSSSELLPLIDAACAKALEWGFQHAMHSERPAPKTVATDYWTRVMSNKFVCAVRQRCLLTATMCLNCIMTWHRDDKEIWLCKPECQFTHGRTPLRVLEEFSHMDLEKSRLERIAPDVSTMMKSYATWPQAEIYFSKDVEKRKTAEARVDASQAENSTWPSEILDPIQQVIHKLSMLEFSE